MNVVVVVVVLFLGASCIIFGFGMFLALQAVENMQSDQKARDRLNARRTLGFSFSSVFLVHCSFVSLFLVTRFSLLLLIMCKMLH